MQFLIKVVINAVGVWVATQLVDGVSIGTGGDELGRVVIALLAVGLILTLVNTVVRPVVKFLTFPFYILTLGLMSFIVSAAMLELTSWVAGELDLAFTIDDFFWSAIMAAVVVTIVSMVLNILIPDERDGGRDRRRERQQWEPHPNDYGRGRY